MASQEEYAGQKQSNKQEGWSPDGYVRLSANSARWKDSWNLTDYEANERETTHKQLIVLDLNGTVLHRASKNKGVRKGYPRPHLGEFLRFALDNFAVMVWSSAQPATIEEMLRKLLHPYYTEFVRVWDRRFCELNGRYFEKSPSIKDLQRICDGFGLDKSPFRNVYGSSEGRLGMSAEKRGHWTIDNIILVDDSESKAARNQDNHVHVATFGNPVASQMAGKPEDDDLLRLKQYLEAYVDNKDAFPSLVSYLKQHPWLEFRNAAGTPASASEAAKQPADGSGLSCAS